MTNDNKMGSTEWLLLVILSVIWGGSFFFAKIALVEIQPLMLVFLRVTLAAIALFLIIKFSHQSIPTSMRVWKPFLIMGVLNNLIPFSLLFWSQGHISSSLASIFNASVPIFTIVIAHFTTEDEHISKQKALGVLLGLLGVALMIGVDIKTDVNIWIILAMLACVGAAFSYGCASVYGRSFQQLQVEPIVVAFGQVTASALIMFIWLMLTGTKLTIMTLSSATIGSVLALALVSTALAYVIFFRILAKGGATNVSLVTFLMPVNAIILGVTFLNEQLKLSHIIGMFIIFMGLIAIDGRIWNKLKTIKMNYIPKNWRTKCKL